MENELTYLLLDAVPNFSTLIVLILVFLLMKNMIKIVRQSEVIIIERLGSFSRVMNSGLHFKIPMIEQIRKMNWRGSEVERIDMRESVMDIPQQTAITKDNVSLEIDAVVYMQITDPGKAVYEINDLPSAISQLTQTTLRSLIGEFDLDETLASRDKINSNLKIVLDEVTDKWGVLVNRVELANVEPPKEVLEAMEKQMQAERERRASVLSAEGDRESRIARSEGERQEKINQASGEKEALIQTAEGERDAAISRANGTSQALEIMSCAERDAIKQIAEALDGDVKLATNYMISKTYIEAYEKFTHGEGDKVYLPYDASKSMAAFGNLGDLFNQSKT
jgi:regulator of protease activity HflC (stomatin/prohibitin superfamily)